MINSEETADYTAEQTAAYEAYLMAIAEHHIVCARPSATTKEKMDAAAAQMRAFDVVRRLMGFEAGRDLRELRLIDGHSRSLSRLIEASRSAWSMIRAAGAMGVIDHLAEGVSQNDHNACVCLIQDAEVVLRQAIAVAEGE